MNPKISTRVKFRGASESYDRWPNGREYTKSEPKPEPEEKPVTQEVKE